MIRAIMLVAVLAIVLSVAGCGGPTQPSDFSVTTVEGDEFELAEKQGEVVALYFMAGY